MILQGVGLWVIVVSSAFSGAMFALLALDLIKILYDKQALAKITRESVERDLRLGVTNIHQLQFCYGIDDVHGLRDRLQALNFYVGVYGEL